MKGTSHLLFGASTAATLVLVQKNLNIQLNEVDNIILVSSTLVGSMLPDIDSPTSFIGRIFYPISKFIEKHFMHRGLFHDMFLTLILFIISIFTLLIFKELIFFGIMIGYIGHLFLDALTEAGVCFNYFKNRNAYKNYGAGYGKDYGDGVIYLLPSFLRFKSNSFIAKVVTIILSCVNIYIALNINEYVLFIKDKLALVIN